MSIVTVTLVVIVVSKASPCHTDSSPSCNEQDATTAEVDTSTTEASVFSKSVDCSFSHNFLLFKDLNGLRVSSINHLLDKRPYGFYTLQLVSPSIESCIDTCALHASCVSFTAASTIGRSETTYDDIETFSCYGSDEPFDIFTNLSRTEGHHSGICLAGTRKLIP